MTPILRLTSIYYISQQNRHNATYILWPKRLLLFVIYMLHVAVLLLAQLHCMVKLKYPKFVSLPMHTFISLK